MILSKLCIYVENLDDFVELQEYFFTQDIVWTGNGKKIFTSWSDGVEIKFPRNLMLGSNKNIFNCGMNDSMLNNDFKLKEVNGKKLLRKLKLEKLKN